MPRPNIADFERAKLASLKRPARLDEATLAKRVGLANTPTFQALVRAANIYLDRHETEALGQDPARYLRQGFRDLRDRLDAALTASRRFHGVFEGLVEDALGEADVAARPLYDLPRSLQAAIDVCDAAIVNTPTFKPASPRKARERLVLRLALTFQQYATSRRWSTDRQYELHLKKFLRAVLEARDLTLNEERTVFQKLVPAPLRRPARR